MMRRLALASALFVAVGSAAPSMAVAGSAASNLNISASVPDNCTISTEAVNFGAYDSSSNAEATGTVTILCTIGTSATITLGQGNNAGDGSTDTQPLRRLGQGSNADKLSYDLYKNTLRSDFWGNTNETGKFSGGTGSNQSLTVYGRIPSGQNVPVGSYADTVVATVSY